MTANRYRLVQRGNAKRRHVISRYLPQAASKGTAALTGCGQTIRGAFRVTYTNRTADIDCYDCLVAGASGRLA